MQAFSERDEVSEEEEAEVEGVLGELASAFDPRCHFHQKNRMEPASEEMDAAALEAGMDFTAAESDAWAEPCALADELPLDSGQSGPRGLPWEGSPTPADGNQRVWLAFLINLFGHRGGVAAINKVGTGPPGWREVEPLRVVVNGLRGDIVEPESLKLRLIWPAIGRRRKGAIASHHDFEPLC